MSDVSVVPEESTSCPQCQLPVAAQAKFCGHCGHMLVYKPNQDTSDIFEAILPTLLYYFITLMLLLVYKFTEAFPEGFEGMLFLTIIDVSLVIAFWIHAWNNVKPLWSLHGLRIWVVFQVILVAMATGFFVTVVADWLNLSISDDEFYSPYLFEDTAMPLVFSIVFICVQPAIFEEVAFRGFLFNNLLDVTSKSGAIYITSFLFGIIHLAVISLIWLIPLGIISAMLRTKFKTLWYGVIAHFIYNLTITLIEFNTI
jgi:uncharacterized protein